MNCPKCGAKIDYVGVYSHCTQTGTLDGNKIISYDDTTVSDTIEINCPECDADVQGYVEET